MDDQTKDNLTDVASQIDDRPDSSQPQDLANNQVVGTDGTVIDLNIDSQNTTKK